MKAWKAIGILLFCFTYSWALCQSDTPADNQNSLTHTITGSGKKGYIPLWTSTSNLGSSNIQQAKPNGWSNTALGLNGAPGSGALLNSTMGVDIEGTVS